MVQKVKDLLGRIKYLKYILIALGIIALIVLTVTISNYQIVKPYKKEIRELKKQNQDLLDANKELVQEQEENSQARQVLIKENDFLNSVIDDREDRINVLSKEIKKVKGTFSKLTNDELVKALIAATRADSLSTSPGPR